MFSGLGGECLCVVHQRDIICVCRCSSRRPVFSSSSNKLGRNSVGLSIFTANERRPAGRPGQWDTEEVQRDGLPVLVAVKDIRSVSHRRRRRRGGSVSHATTADFQLWEPPHLLGHIVCARDREESAEQWLYITDRVFGRTSRPAASWINCNINSQLLANHITIRQIRGVESSLQSNAAALLPQSTGIAFPRHILVYTYYVHYIDFEMPSELKCVFFPIFIFHFLLRYSPKSNEIKMRRLWVCLSRSSRDQQIILLQN